MVRPLTPPTEEQRAIIGAIAAQPVSVRDACRRLDVGVRVTRRWLDELGVLPGILQVSKARERKPKPPPKRRPTTLSERIAAKREAKQAYEDRNREQVRSRKADRERARRQRMRAEGIKAEPPAPPPEPPRELLIDVTGMRPEFPPGPTMIHDRWKRRRVRERIAAGQKVDVILAMSGGVSREAIEFEMQNWREAR